jgi:hypothetical protein
MALYDKVIVVYKKQLDQFFKTNQTQSDVPSAAAIAHFSISMEQKPEAAVQIREVMNGIVYKEQPGRRDEVLAERIDIESADTCDQVIGFIRRRTDPINQHILINKAMEFEDEIIPEIIRRLRTNLNAGYIEKAIRVLAMSSHDVAEAMIDCFDDIRSPYAQSMTLVMLGFKADELRIPWFIEKYNELQSLYPTESHCEGAYYALSEMGNRFYPHKK